MKIFLVGDFAAFQHNDGGQRAFNLPVVKRLRVAFKSILNGQFCGGYRQRGRVHRFCEQVFVKKHRPHIGKIADNPGGCEQRIHPHQPFQGGKAKSQNQRQHDPKAAKGRDDGVFQGNHGLAPVQMSGRVWPMPRGAASGISGFATRPTGHENRPAPDQAWRHPAKAAVAKPPRPCARQTPSKTTQRGLWGWRGHRRP